MYIDLDIVYAMLKPDDRHNHFAKVITASKEKKYSSIALLIELEIILKRDFGENESLNSKILLDKTIPGLKILEINSDIFEKSLSIRAEYGLGIFDSLHAASCLANDGRIASTDHAYDKITGITRVKPSA